MKKTNQLKYLIALSILLLSLFSFTNTKAQGSFFLEQKVCDSSKVFYSDIIQKPDGSFFVSGYYNVDTGTNQIPVLIKLNVNYQEVIRKAYVGSINRDDIFWKIRLLPNGNLLVLGSLESKDGAFAGFDTNSLSCNSILIAELDTLGNFIKTKTFAYCGQTIPTDIVLDRHNNIYICGHTISKSFDFSANPEIGLETNVFLIRMDTAFNTKWLSILDGLGSQDIEPHICINQNDEVLFTTSSLDKGGYYNAITPTPTGFIYLSCIDSNQTLIWQKCYGSINNAIGTDYYEAPTQIIFDSLKTQILITGFCTSKDGDMYDSLDHNPFPTTESSFILKLNSLGNKIWCHRYGAFSSTNPTSGKIPFAVAFDKGALIKDNDIYLLSEVMYSDTNWTGIALNNNQQEDQWLIKVDSIGSIKNKLRIGNVLLDSYSWIKQNNLNNKILVGMRSATSNCYPGSTSGYLIYECGVWATYISEHQIITPDITISPNPANMSCNINFEIASNEIYHVIISDASGKKIRKEKIELYTTNYQLDMQDLVSGIYFLQLKSKTTSTNFKLIKE